jgi:hypothetical protein
MNAWLIGLLGLGGVALYLASQQKAPVTAPIPSPNYVPVPPNQFTATLPVARPPITAGGPCGISPPCSPGQACSMIIEAGRYDANGVCQPISFTLTSFKAPVPSGGGSGQM